MSITMSRRDAARCYDTTESGVALRSMLSRHYITTIGHVNNKFECQIQRENLITKLNIDVSNNNDDPIRNLSERGVVYLFADILGIRDFDRRSQCVDDDRLFTFEVNGIVSTHMANKLVAAHVQYTVNRQYRLLNTQMNEKHFLGRFGHREYRYNFNITDSTSLVRCFNANEKSARIFLIFVNVFSNNNNIITCKVKYKIYF